MANGGTRSDVQDLRLGDMKGVSSVWSLESNRGLLVANRPLVALIVDVSEIGYIVRSVFTSIS